MANLTYFHKNIFVLGITCETLNKNIFVLSVENELIKNEWNFVAITIDGNADENYFYVNDGYGSNTQDDFTADEPTNGRVSNFI